MRRDRLLPLLAMTCAALMLCACDQNNSSKTADTASTASDTSASKDDAKDSAAAEEQPKTKESEEDRRKQAEAAFTAALDEAIAGCKQISEANNPTQCAGGEDKKLMEVMRTHRLRTLPAVVHGLAAAELDKRRVSARTLKLHTVFHFGDAARNEGEVSEQVAKTLIELVKRTEPGDHHIAQDAMQAAVLAGTITGQDDAVRELLKAFSPEKSTEHAAVYSLGLEVVMVYGRMGLFDEVKQAVEQQHSKDVQRAAFVAPRRMKKWEFDEDTAICAWAKSYLPRIKPEWDGGPGRVLLECIEVEEMRGAVLDVAAKRLKDGTYAKPFSIPVTKLCQTDAFAGDGRNHHPVICERTRSFLEKLAGMKRLAKEERVIALTAIERYWPSERTQKLVEKHASLKK